MRTNYVLIDYENVQPSSLAGLDAEHFRVIVFVGASQSKLTFDTAAAVQKLGGRAEYIKISGNGSNALDFHIAFHMGRIAAEDPRAFFHVISKDTGFDPLIQHLKERKVSASRSKDVADIPLLKASNLKSAPERMDVVVANLQQRGASRPRTIKTLTSTISSLFQKQLSVCSRAACETMRRPCRIDRCWLAIPTGLPSTHAANGLPATPGFGMPFTTASPCA